MMTDQAASAAVRLGPITQRIELLDVLRGFALLGVLAANMFAYPGWIFLDPNKAAALPAASFDPQLYQAMVALIEAKFYSLFSLLFGLGFAVMLERFESRGANPIPAFQRRYSALFLIGTLHAVFIFHGDILMLYGLLGFALLLFKRQSVRALVIWAIGMLLLPIILYGIGLTLMAQADGGSPSPTTAQSAFDAFKSSDYARIIAGNIVLNIGNWLRRLVLMFYPRVFAMFLLGFALGKMAVFREPSRHRRLLYAFSIAGVLLGLPSSILFAVFTQHESLLPLTPHGFFRTVFESIGTPLLCLGYVAWITFLFQSRRWQRTLLWLAPIGRTALSNYLLQGVVSMFLFYGIGGGLFMKVSLTTSVAIALGLFAVEAVVSRLWLSRFRYGPVEWIWRQVTYWKRVPLRRNAEAALPVPAP
jgi:uncharacterized protein